MSHSMQYYINDQKKIPLIRLLFIVVRKVLEKLRYKKTQTLINKEFELILRGS